MGRSITHRKRRLPSLQTQTTDSAKTSRTPPLQRKHNESNNSSLLQSLDPQVLQRLDERSVEQSAQLTTRSPLNQNHLTIQRSPESIWSSHEDALDHMRMKPHKVRQMLRDDFYSNWFIAKDYLVSNRWQNKSNSEIAEKRPRFERLMRSLLAVREYDTDKLLRHIRDTKLPAKYPHLKNLDPAKRLSWSAAGSQTLTSDIDVNLKGAGSIPAVGLFNKLFKTQERWPYDPGTVYDVNVYAQDFMTPDRPKTLVGGHKKLGSPFRKNEQENSTTLTPIEEVPTLTQQDTVAFEAFSLNQDVWSMTKMRMYMSDNEWNAYKQDLLGAEMTELEIQNNPEGYHQRLQIESQLADAEYSYRQYQRSIAIEVANIDDPNNKAYKKVRQALARGGNLVSNHRKQETKEMIAANVIYERKLERVETLRSQLEELKAQQPRTPDVVNQIRGCGIKLKNSLSEAIMFSNEAYFSQGAVQDVVLGYQIGKGMEKKKQKENPNYHVDLRLANNLRLQSMREQVGDTLKILNEYRTQPAWKGVYKAGKYIDRMILSADPLLPESISIDFDSDFAFIRNLGQKATELKSEGANEATQRTQLGNMIQSTTLAQIRQMIIRIGTFTEQHYRNIQ
ncbi:hypothetical protein [Roseofilum casamattae]|uniref:Uncharacterized protein n=1 Tax=Roseofilum casamattae BLCC-M143 TaxID=3022442 RepID=A0ABT7BZF5_9CYAN|nr:hypothetical protein [Roseofilum casamattae]MDJ1183653.1 hypothetical protein [Roseofilum casamattae BLCC-M143]